MRECKFLYVPTNMMRYGQLQSSGLDCKSTFNLAVWILYSFNLICMLLMHTVKIEHCVTIWSFLINMHDAIRPISELPNKRLKLFIDCGYITLDQSERLFFH